MPHQAGLIWVKFPTVQSLTRVKCLGIAWVGEGMGGFGIDWYVISNQNDVCSNFSLEEYNSTYPLVSHIRIQSLHRSMSPALSHKFADSFQTSFIMPSFVVTRHGRFCDNHTWQSPVPKLSVPCLVYEVNLSWRGRERTGTTQIWEKNLKKK